jgi:hypothetical protein
VLIIAGAQTNEGARQQHEAEISRPRDNMTTLQPPSLASVSLCSADYTVFVLKKPVLASNSVNCGLNHWRLRSLLLKGRLIFSFQNVHVVLVNVDAASQSLTA